jgi:hypothetical protein
MRRLLAALARQRLLHFAVLGGLLFALSRGTHRARPDGIDLSSRAIDALCRERMRELGVTSLDQAERTRVASEAIEDELLYREALHRGLAHDDELVRTRLIARDLATSDEMLAAMQGENDAEVRRRASAAHLRKLFSSQRITIDGNPVESLVPTGRVPEGTP